MLLGGNDDGVALAREQHRHGRRWRTRNSNDEENDSYDINLQEQLQSPDLLQLFDQAVRCVEEQYVAMAGLSTKPLFI